MRAGFMTAAFLIAVASPAAANNKKKPWLGVSIVTNCHVTVGANGETYKNPGCRDGARIEQIFPDTPAHRAGLKPFDVVTKVSGVAVTQATDLITEITTKHRVGDVAELEVLRNGRSIRVQATLDAMFTDSEMFAKSLVGARAREIGQLPRVAGKVTSSAISNHRGDVVIVYLFSRLCRRCSTTSKIVDGLHVALGSRGLAVLAYAEEDPDVASRLAREQKLRMPVFSDSLQGVRQSLGLKRGELPAVVVIGRDGVVCYAALGDGVDAGELRIAVDRALRPTAAVR